MVDAYCVVVAGLAGVGKSTVGKAAAAEFGYVYLDKDTLFSDFVDFHGGVKGDRESSFYKKHMNPLEYKMLARVAIENVRLGHGVVLSAPFVAQLQDKMWLERHLPGVAVKVVWVRADRETEKRRITVRGLERDRWKLANWHTYCKSVEQSNASLPKDVYIFDNGDGNEANGSQRVAQLVSWIRT